MADEVQFHEHLEHMVTASIALQADEVFNQGKQASRWNTHFYKVVLGGNVDSVKQVIQYMSEHRMTPALNWLLMKEAKKLDTSSSFCNKVKRFLTRLCMLLIFSTFSLVVSPVFYMLHILSNTLMNRTQRRISVKSNLPLALAVFSQSEHMIRYFLSAGVDVEQVDKEGNNVFHYVADLSATSPRKAMSMLDTILKVASETVRLDVIKMMLVDNRNSAGLTVLEYSVKYGALAFTTKVLKLPNILQESEIAVGKEHVSLGSTGASLLTDAQTRLELVDVTKYEAGSLADQSTLLNLLSDTDIVSMTTDDLQVFGKLSFMADWIHLKLKQMFLGVTFFHIIDLSITGLVLLMISTGTVSNLNVWVNHHQTAVRLTEIEALAHNTSHTFKTSRFHRLLEDAIYEKQVEYLDKLLVNEHDRWLLKEATSKTNENVTEFFTKYLEHGDVKDIKPSQLVVNDIYDAAMMADNMKKNRTMLYVLRHFHSILRTYAAEVFAKYPRVSTQDLSILNREEVQQLLSSFYENFTVTGDLNSKWQNMIFTPRLVFSSDDMLSAVCIPYYLFSIKDLLPSSVPYPPENYYRHSCELKFLLNAAEKLCKKDSVTSDDVYERFSSMESYKKPDMRVLLLVLAVLTCASTYLVLDLFERIVFMYTCIIHQTTASAMVITACNRKVPGSYARKQINVCTHLGLILFLLTLTFAGHLRKEYGVTDDQVEQFLYFILILTLILRFVMHIHAMRLLPGIGHFVISTFLMGTNLIHFSAIFGIVVMIFAGIFYMISNKAECPVLKEDGFTTIVASLLSTFQLAFGHGGFDVYSSSAAMSLTYFLYVVIVGLLLMNLIIAVMSSTATQIMLEPWKSALWQIEWLDEATSVEYTFRVLGLLCRCCSTCGYVSHSKAGFVVKKETDNIKIYIERFHCPTMD